MGGASGLKLRSTDEDRVARLRRSWLSWAPSLFGRGVYELHVSKIPAGFSALNNDPHLCLNSDGLTSYDGRLRRNVVGKRRSIRR